MVGQLSAESICGCFTSTSRQASCNYGIGTDGRVSLCVEEKNRSWCSSSNANDQRAVTIECASDMNEPYAMNSAVYDSLVKGELILTILSALAQDESRSISDNIRWSIQKKFQSGVSHINLKRMLGYELGANKQWVIVPEQAEIIRYIFDRFVKGQTANKIALELNQMEKFTVNGKKWSASSILIVLRNEKYVGDIEMQKTITKDFLTHRSSINKGEAPRYYVKNHHVGIIDRVTWDKVQTMLFEKPRADMTKVF